MPNRLPSHRTRRHLAHALWALSGDSTNRLYHLALDAWRNGATIEAAALSAVIRHAIA